jgi:hypothetical protein
MEELQELIVTVGDLKFPRVMTLIDEDETLINLTNCFPYLLYGYGRLATPKYERLCTVVNVLGVISYSLTALDFTTASECKSQIQLRYVDGSVLSLPEFLIVVKPSYKP